MAPNTTKYSLHDHNGYSHLHNAGAHCENISNEFQI